MIGLVLRGFWFGYDCCCLGFDGVKSMKITFPATHFWGLVKTLSVLALVILTSKESIQRFVELSASENPLRNQLVFLSIWALTIYVLLSAGFARTWFARWLFLLVFAASTLTFQIYLNVTGNVISYGDLHSLWIGRHDWMSAVKTYFNVALSGGGWNFILLSTVLIPTGLPKSVDRLFWPGRHLLLVLLLTIGLMVEKKGGAAATGLPEQVKSAALFGHILYSEMTNDFDETRLSVKSGPSTLVGTASGSGTSPLRPHLVLVIDESIRGDFLSINNKEMKTTPFLESLGSKVSNFGYASSSHDCSHYANSTLRFGTKSTHPKKTLLSNPSIWEYAKLAGYETTYLDSQRRMGQLQNFMSPKERELIATFVQFDKVDAVERSDEFVRKDELAARQLRMILSKSVPQFVIVNKEGAHTPYEGKYPESEARFFPKLSLGESIYEGQSREKLVNSYRNAVSWSVDHFFQELITPSYRFADTVVIYTGDHGQNLMDRGLPTHCASLALSVIGSVPLFLITDNVDVLTWLKPAIAKNVNRASHFNVFRTMLKIMGYQDSDLEVEYDPDLTGDLPVQRVWYTGDILKDAERLHTFQQFQRERIPE